MGYLSIHCFLFVAVTFQVKCQDRRPYLIDASDPSHSNWLRFVNCARSEDEQNVSAFQFEGQIFYRTIKSVYPGTELLVWYGDQYASKLGISVDAEGESARFEGGGGGLLHICPSNPTSQKSKQQHANTPPITDC